MTLKEISSVPVGQSLLRNKEIVTVLSTSDITEKVGEYKNDSGKIIDLWGRTIVIEFIIHSTGRTVVIVSQHPRPETISLEQYSA